MNAKILNIKYKMENEGVDEQEEEMELKHNNNKIDDEQPNSQ